MGKYIHKFNTDTDLQTWKISSGYVEPNISYVAEEEKIKFTDDDIDVSGMGLLKQWLSSIDIIDTILISDISGVMPNTSASTSINLYCPYCETNNNMNISRYKKNYVKCDFKYQELTKNVPGLTIQKSSAQPFFFPISLNSSLKVGDTVPSPSIAYFKPTYYQLLGHILNPELYRKIIINTNAVVRNEETFLIDAQTFTPIKNGTVIPLNDEYNSRFVFNNTGSQSRVYTFQMNIERNGDLYISGIPILYKFRTQYS